MTQLMKTARRDERAILEGRQRSLAIDLGGKKVNINVPPPNAAAAADATDVIGAKSFIIMVIQSGKEGREKERERERDRT